MQHDLIKVHTLDDTDSCAACDLEEDFAQMETMVDELLKSVFRLSQELTWARKNLERYHSAACVAEWHRVIATV